MAEGVWDVVRAALLVAGSALMLLGAVGIVRMPDVYTRAQASAKTGTLGVGLIFLAVALQFDRLGAVVQAVAVIAFAFLSVPLAAHMIARAAHRGGQDPWPEGSRDELRESGEW